MILLNHPVVMFLPLEIRFYDRLPMQSVAISMIRVCNIHIQKSGLPTITWCAKKIDSSPAKGERSIINLLIR